MVESQKHFQQFASVLQRYLHTDMSYDSLLVAYSGGLDSSLLLHYAVAFARQQQLNISAIHVNHNLSNNAGQWQQHCESRCRVLGIPLTIKQVQVNADGMGVEAAAREARYAAIAEVSVANSLVLLGQHQSDQVETFMLQLLRGAGPAGLSAMAEFSVNAQGSHLLRPLLNLSRTEIESEAKAAGLSWVEDESNQNDDFERNYLRNQVWPLVAQRWPQYETTICRSVSHIAEQNTLFQQQVSEKRQDLTTENGQLHISGLAGYSHSWQKQILMSWLKASGATLPSAKVLQVILEECVLAKVDAQPLVKWGDWQCQRYDNLLYLRPLKEYSVPKNCTVQLNQWNILPGNAGQLWIGREASEIGQTVYLPEKGEFTATFGQFSRRFKPLGSAHSKPIKQWFKEWKVPPWQRQLTPILCCEQVIVSVGERVCTSQPQPGYIPFTIRWQK